MLSIEFKGAGFSVFLCFGARPIPLNGSPAKGPNFLNPHIEFQDA